VAVLGSIVAIRTVISFFLNRELQIARDYENGMMKNAAAKKTDV
jgi:hypothetical protein